MVLPVALGGPLLPEGLQHRLGGAASIAAIVEEAIDRLAVNPRLAPRLLGKDLPSLKALGVGLLCSGGAHCAAQLDAEEVAAALEDIAAALESQGAGDGEVREVLALLDALAPVAAPA